MTTAIDLFLRETVRMNDIPFVLTTKKEQPNSSDERLSGRGCMKGKMKIADDFDASLEQPNSSDERLSGYGCMKGKMKIADDFDAPLEDFKEYM
jgi:hypothetical protein